MLELVLECEIMLLSRYYYINIDVIIIDYIFVCVDLECKSEVGIVAKISVNFINFDSSAL